MSTAGQRSIPRHRDDNPSRVPWYETEREAYLRFC